MSDHRHPPAKLPLERDCKSRARIATQEQWLRRARSSAGAHGTTPSRDADARITFDATARAIAPPQ
jgi:hypothetical protein